MTEPRSDPIFPTDLNTTGHSGDLSSTFYMRNWPSATALGCVDSLEQCVPDRTICSNISGQRERFSPRDSQKQRYYNLRNPFYPAITFLAALSYYRSDTYWTNANIEERGLDAWRKTTELGFSLGLDQNQWQIEAQKIFNISLARYQLNIMAIARGERIGGGVKEYNAFTLDGFKDGGFRSVCQTIKIGGAGWKNIDLCWFVTFLLLSVCLIVGSFELVGVLVSVRVWKGICEIAKFFFTALLVPMYQKMASIRWRDILVKILGYFQLAANGFGHVMDRTRDLLIRISDRFQLAAERFGYTVNWSWNWDLLVIILGRFQPAASRFGHINRDLLIKSLSYFKSAANEFGYVVNWSWDLLVKLLDRFLSRF
ncbi:hypothetical protein GP486_006711 [Trichoglossum hirsutum]|uniref:Uncharacterized protein n=1 Tax=Trichoglossum hirsutum TaxID=265104 RepID=A0A9P8IGJ3_9PEZI|nr:hypothetical protein GP486_006711 [Trichoglossum hirsutum]